MSGRDTAGNRRLARYQDDPASGPDPETATVDVDEDEDDVDDEPETCAECDRDAEYVDPAEALGNDSLPSIPLCRSHILERA